MASNPYRLSPIELKDTLYFILFGLKLILLRLNVAMTTNA
jgi:hypothetical protein